MRIFVGLFVGVWVARYLGPDDFGVFSYAYAFIAFFSWASYLGLNQIVVRELVKYPKKTNKILGTAFCMRLLGALFSIVLIFISIRIVKPENELIRFVVVLASISYIFQAFDVIDFFFQAKILSKYAVIAQNIAFLASSALKIYFIIAKFDVTYFVVANILELAGSGLFMLYLFLKIGNPVLVWRFDVEVAKELILYCWPLMFSSFFINIHMKLDQVMIDSMLGIREVGIYSVAVKLSESWYFIPTIIASTLMPYFVNLREKSRDLFQSRIIQLFSFMFWLAVIVGMCSILFGKEVIILLFGEEYVNSFYALTLNIFSGVFIAQGLTASVWQIAENLQIYRLYIQVLSVCVNIASNLILIPHLGISGAALSTFITQLFATWIFGLFFKELIPITKLMIKASSPHYMYRFFKEKKYG